MYTEIKACRSCNRESFVSVLDLGMQFVVDFPVEVTSASLQAPLHLVRCNSCQLVQLKHSVAPDELFRTFWYRSGISETMRSALLDIVEKAIDLVQLSPQDDVLDIGSNDGTLLGMYADSVNRIGIEPCKTLAIESVESKRSNLTIQDFFKKEVIPSWVGKFKVITAIAMFYDIENPRKFLEDARDILHDNGVLIIQMNYLKTMLKNTTVDNISHEHLTYWSLSALNKIVESVGLEIRSVEINNVNGGSFRAYIVKRGARLKGVSPEEQLDMREKVLDAIENEYRIGISDGEGIYYDYFKTKVTHKIELIRNHILKTNPISKWFIYGASTRGTALLQVLNLPEGTFIGAAERDPNKVGRKMVAGAIPIHDEEYCRERATNFLVLPYHFKDQIKAREDNWINRGGEMLYPLPEPTLVTNHGEIRL